LRIAALTLLALVALAAPASAKTETATDGTVRGELSYTPHPDRAPTGLTERVFIDDELIVERRLADDDFLYPGAGVEGKSVKVTDLDGDGRGEVVFDLYTGGAHCCLISDVFNGKKRLALDWGNIGYRLQDFEGDGVPEFRTADDRFSGVYTAYAFSQQPLLVHQYTGSKVVDFTRDPAVASAIRRESAKFKRDYKKYRERNGIVARSVVVSSLAAYAADRCNLDACARGYALIEKAVARGDVRKFDDFLRTVRRDLRKFGYDRG
jgi:hypothetical protein